MLNNSSREIDISNWVLQSVSGTAMFVFPINSIILPGRYFVLSNKVSKFSIGDSRITLLFPAPLGGIAAEWGTSNTPPNPASVQSRTQPNTGTVLGVNISAKPDSAAARELPALTPQGRGGTHLTQAGTSTEEPVAQVLWQKNPPAPTQSGGFLSGVQFGGREGWLFILIASSLILVAGYVIMRSQRHEASIEDEYAIIEDIIEGVEDQPKIG